jgi:hypothetical protein
MLTGKYTHKEPNEQLTMQINDQSMIKQRIDQTIKSCIQADHHQSFSNQNSET